MSEQSVASPAAAPPQTVHELLRQLVESRFVLTDRDGAITRWSGPAQALFGWEPHAMLGRPMLETLGIAVSPPRHGGRLTANARLRDGRDVEVELVFIPVRMSQSLEFNGFLSALEQMSADALSVERLRSGHYGVVDWIEASMGGQGTLADDELAAGTIVTFRPTAPIDLYEDEQGEDGDDEYEEFDDFDDIERALAGTATSVEAVRADAAAARSEAAVASERVGTLEAQSERLRAELEQTRTLVESLQGELAQSRSETTEQGSALAESLRDELQQVRGATIEESRTLVEELREGLEKVRKRVRQVSDQEYGAQLEALRSELSVLRANSTEDASRDSEALDKLIADVEEQAKEARKAAAAAEGRLEETATRAEQAAAAAERHLEEAHAAAEQAAVEAEVARVQAEAAQTRPRRRTRSSAATPAETRTDLHAPLFGREEDKGPDRELRPGFDDAKEPMATIALDGHFRELNKPFSELVGYKEKEFAACTWPPVMDRANLPKHREQMRALVAGESESVEVNTGYVHAQGLLVPVVGTLTLHRGDDEPDHFLLRLVRP